MCNTRLCAKRVVGREKMISNMESTIPGICIYMVLLFNNYKKLYDAYTWGGAREEVLSTVKDLNERVGRQ